MEDAIVFNIINYYFLIFKIFIKYVSTLVYYVVMLVPVHHVKLSLSEIQKLTVVVKLVIMI